MWKVKKENRDLQIPKFKEKCDLATICHMISYHLRSCLAIPMINWWGKGMLGREEGGNQKSWALSAGDNLDWEGACGQFRFQQFPKYMGTIGREVAPRRGKCWHKPCLEWQGSPQPAMGSLPAQTSQKLKKKARTREGNSRRKQGPVREFPHESLMGSLFAF